MKKHCEFAVHTLRIVSYWGLVRVRKGPLGLHNNGDTHHSIMSERLAVIGIGWSLGVGSDTVCSISLSILQLPATL